MLRRRATLAVITANVLGAIMYVVEASSSWAIPEERAAGIYSITGEPFVWAFSVWPVLTLFILLNLVWAGVLISRRRWRDPFCLDDDPANLARFNLNRLRAPLSVSSLTTQSSDPSQTESYRFSFSCWFADPGAYRLSIAAAISAFVGHCPRRFPECV